MTEVQKEKLTRIVHGIQDRLWYAALMGLLAFVSAGMLAYEVFSDTVTAEQVSFMTTLDLGIAYMFLTDYLAGFIVAPQKLHHFKHTWLDLLSSIPLSEGLFRAMRVLRFARLMRLVRAASIGMNLRGPAQKLTHRE